MYLSSIIFSGPAGQARRERVGGSAAAGWGEGALAIGGGSRSRSEQHLLLGTDDKTNNGASGGVGGSDFGAAAATSTPMAKKSNDSCANVEQHVDRVVTKFAAYLETYENALNDLVSSLLQMQNALIEDEDAASQVTEAGVVLWEKAIKKVRDQLERMGTDHRELHGGVSKCGREIDKNFEQSFVGLCSKEAHQYETDTTSRDLVNKLIAQHLLSNGNLDVADCFGREAGIDLDEANKAKFVEMQAILDALARRDLDSALEWAKANREHLLALNSSLEFSLHKLKFIELLKYGVDGQLAAVQYVRENMQHFAEKHIAEIQALMGSLLFLPSGIEKSPYGHFLDPALWSQIADMFTKDSRALMGMSVNSPLSILLNSGMKAVPALINIRQVMLQRNVISMWGHNDELPIEIDLGPENRFHSIFSCPILRQQTSDNNPPMRLTCGHVISKEALLKLASSNKLKCPYCPVESALSEAKQIYF